MVLFQVPAGHQNSGIEMGMILTCWRGVKAPKIFSGPVNVNACVAFRAVALEVSSEDRLIIGWGWMGQVDHRMFSAKAALVYACICNGVYKTQFQCDTPLLYRLSYDQFERRQQ